MGHLAHMQTSPLPYDSVPHALYSCFGRMSFEDFCAHFTNATLCHVINTSFFTLSKRWRVFKHTYRWTPGSTAGGCVENRATFLKNPQVLSCTLTLICYIIQYYTGTCITISGVIISYAKVMLHKSCHRSNTTDLNPFQGVVTISTVRFHSTDREGNSILPFLVSVSLHT